MTQTQIVRSEKQNEIMFMVKCNAAAIRYFKCQTFVFFSFHYLSCRSLVRQLVLCSFLRLDMVLRKSSYQKKVNPVESAAFIRLGFRPLNKPRTPSSLAICITQSIRPL